MIPQKDIQKAIEEAKKIPEISALVLSANGKTLGAVASQTACQYCRSHIGSRLKREVWGHTSLRIQSNGLVSFIADHQQFWEEPGKWNQIWSRSADETEAKTPPAETPRTINLNDTFKMKLTEKGAQILNDDQAFMRRSLGGHLNQEAIDKHFGTVYKAGDEYKAQLWQVMNLFGQHLHNGCDSPFEHNALVPRTPRE